MLGAALFNRRLHPESQITTHPIIDMKTMNRKLTLPIFALAAFLPIAAQADVPGRHPHYLRALADLRDAAPTWNI